MDEASLDRQLSALEPAEIDAARRRAAAAVADGVEAANRSEGRRPRLRTGGVAAALCAGLIAFAVLTAPGQAVTAWAGERLGIGEPGGPPSLDELRASWNQGTAADGQPAYIVAAGPAPHAGNYEFITYQAKESQNSGPLSGEPCFELNLIQERSSTGQGCGVFPEGATLYSNGFGGGFGRSGEEVFYTSGRASADVEAIEVRFNDRPVDVELVSISPDLLDRLKIETPFKFFIAFLPDGARGGPLTISAHDQEGDLMAREESLIPDLLAGDPGYIPGRSDIQP
jgi:hypothetical protein